MDFTQYLDKALELGAKAVNEHGQQAWETTLWIVRISTLQDLVVAIVGVIVALLFWFPIRKRVVSWADRTNNDELIFPFVIFGGGAATIFGGIGLVILFNVWTWIGIFYPELYLAKMALEKVL